MQITTLVWTTITWFVILVLLCAELKSYTKEYVWYVRFTVIYALVAQTTMFNYVLTLRDYYDSIVLQVVVSHYGAQALFTLFYVLYLPKLEQVEYTPVSVQDVTLAPADYEPLAGGETVCPEFKCNVIARLLFNWMTPLMQVGYKRPITDPDVWQLDESDKTEELYSTFQRYAKISTISVCRCFFFLVCVFLIVLLLSSGAGKMNVTSRSHGCCEL